MISRLLAALVSPLAVTLSLTCAVPAIAAPRTGVEGARLEGTWGQWMTCRTHDNNVKFYNKIKIYRNREGLRFVGNAPLPKVSDSTRDELFAGNYYGAARLDGDVLTLRVSDRYKRDFQDKRLVRYGTMIAQDAIYRVTPDGRLIAQEPAISVKQGGCEGTPLKKG